MAYNLGNYRMPFVSSSTNLTAFTSFAWYPKVAMEITGVEALVTTVIGSPTTEAIFTIYVDGVAQATITCTAATAVGKEISAVLATGKVFPLQVAVGSYVTISLTTVASGGTTTGVVQFIFDGREYPQ